MKLLNWIFGIKEPTDEEIDENLMKAGYLCTGHTLHRYKLLDWEDNIRKRLEDKAFTFKTT